MTSLERALALELRRALGAILGEDGKLDEPQPGEDAGRRCGDGRRESTCGPS